MIFEKKLRLSISYSIVTVHLTFMQIDFIITIANTIEGNLMNKKRRKNKKHRKEQKKPMDSFIVGNNDLCGNTIREIYAKYEDFVVYSVDDDESSFLVHIDPVTQRDVRRTWEKYDKIVPDAFKYKNIKHKVEDIGEYNMTLALAISTALGYEQNEDDEAINKRVDDAKNILSAAIDNYEGLYDERLKGKFVYFLVCLGYVFLFILIATALYFRRDTNIVKLNMQWFQIFGCGSFALIGGLISTIIKLPQLTFEKKISKWFYAIYACERMVLAFFCGSIVWVLAKSNIAFGFLENTSYWALLGTSVIAGFSEKFVPELITKTQTNIKPQKKK